MIKLWRLTKGLLLMAYLVFLLHLMLNNEAISTTYEFPTWFLPTLAIISIIFIGIRFTQLSIKRDKFEIEFTSIVNHTFRTPLTSIAWFAKELEKDLPRESRIQYLQNLSNSTERILGVVDTLAGIKKVEDRSTYFFQAVSIRELVESSMSKHKEAITKKNLSFNVSTFTNTPLLTVDIKRISFVIDVLIENAIFYTPKGGNIDIGAEVKHSKIILHVSDNGLGLNMIDKMRIFDKFYRGKDARKLNTDGMGLGLYLAKQIITRHRGHMYAHSRGRNKGSKFFIVLPIK